MPERSPAPRTDTGCDEWLSAVQLAAELDLSVDTVYAWRSKRSGPRAYRIGRHLRYRRRDIEEWLATRVSA